MSGRKSGRRGKEARLRAPFSVVLGAVLAALVPGPPSPETTPAPQVQRVPQRVPKAETQEAYAGLIDALSEPGGYFDTDNLLSNETSYVQIVDRLEPMGGVYIGVGPEQNFTYIARLHPRWAFILDLRRDNMLHHLLLGAVLRRASTPYDYLCWLFSRAPAPGAPSAPSSPSSKVESAGDLDDVLRAFGASTADESVFERNLAALVDSIGRDLDVELTAADRGVLRHIYRAYFDQQLEIRFRTFGRTVQLHHPTYRTLLEARTPLGNRAHFLASPEAYAVVRDLARAGRLVPVVGDFAGPHALRAIGAFARRKGLVVTSFYVSNVEFYLLRSGKFDAFVENVRTLPIDDRSFFIRAYFDYGRPHPAALPGHRSTTVRQHVRRFLALFDGGSLHSFWDVCTTDDLR